MEPEVFISYAKKDKAFADVIYGKLKINGIRPWMAPEDILPGETWADAIVRAIRQSTVMILIFSSHSNVSKHVRRELDRAASRHIVMKIILFRIENITPSEHVEFYTAGSQWLDALPKPLEEHYRVLLEAVKSLLIGKGDKPNKYEQGLRTVENLLRRDQWLICLTECVELFEGAMKELLTNLSSSLKDRSQLERITAINRRIGQEDPTLQNCELTQLIIFFTEIEVLDLLCTQLPSNLQKIKRIDWKQVQKLDTASRNRRHSVEIKKESVIEIVYYLKLFLYDTGLVGELPPPPPARAQECPRCEQLLVEGWKYCPRCGTALDVFCENCHRHVEINWNICKWCDKPIYQLGTGDIDDFQKAKAKQEYRDFCEGVWADGVLNIWEIKQLREKRLQIGLTIEEAEYIERDCAHSNVLEYCNYVQGVLVDGIIDENERSFLDRKALELNIEPRVQKQIDDTQIAIRKGALDDLEPHKLDDDKSQKAGKSKSVVKKKKTIKRKRKAIQKKKKRT